MATIKEKQAKQKDDGKMALLGMKLYLAMRFGVDINSEAVDYIVSTFLECMDGITFQQYMMGENRNEETIQKPLIISFESMRNSYFVKMMKFYDNDGDKVLDIVKDIFNTEFFTDDYQECIYCTEIGTSFLCDSDIDMNEVKRCWDILTGLGALKIEDIHYIKETLEKNHIYLDSIDFDNVSSRNEIAMELDGIFGFDSIVTGY